MDSHDKLLNSALSVVAMSSRCARRKPRVILVNQGKPLSIIASFLASKGIADVHVYDSSDVKPLAVVDGRVYFVGSISGSEVLSFAYCLSEAICTDVVSELVLDGILVVTEEHCIWCTPFIHGACKLSYRDGYIVSIVDFHYHPEIWYDKLGIDEVPALVYKGRVLSTGSPEDPEQAYNYIKKLLTKNKKRFHCND